MARSFNGTSDRISADGAGVYGASSAFSISCWLKGAAGQFNVDFYGEGEAANPNGSFVRLHTSGAGSNGVNFAVTIKNDAGTTVLDVGGTKAIMDGTYHHVVLTHDSAHNYKTYVDGVQDLSGSYTPGTVSVSKLTFGALTRSTSVIDFWAGSLAHVALFTRTLTIGEVSSLAHGLLPSHLGPAHYWPLWGSDSPEPDIGIGTHVGGTLTGTTGVQAGPPTNPFLVAPTQRFVSNHLVLLSGEADGSTTIVGTLLRDRGLSGTAAGSTSVSGTLFLLNPPSFLSGQADGSTTISSNFVNPPPVALRFICLDPGTISFLCRTPGVLSFAKLDMNSLSLNAISSPVVLTLSKQSSNTLTFVPLRPLE